MGKTTSVLAFPDEYHCRELAEKGQMHGGGRKPCACSARRPYTATVTLGDSYIDYPVGQWAAEQRRAWRNGELEDWRTELLAETGFVFDPRDQAFTEFLDVCALYFAEHHTLAAPREAAIAGVRSPEQGTVQQAREAGLLA
ncbi:helicase associated domain-containing protein [Streptomyces sp. 3N207]|uniref:helicase associated domain-containing protein n=1 Tax=Streptomyces sp. 3N207 TaxID=3457417 RepID=UPI003FD1688D